MNTIITRQSPFQPEYATLFQQRGYTIRTASEMAMIPVGLDTFLSHKGRHRQRQRSRRLPLSLFNHIPP